ncbi:DUF2919 family protein [Salmonella enterica]|nr:DUF2919 family protein [Salmonella enterica]EDG9478818.1 DUF2919 family protein [Salmonella enterica subsp. enterica serovar Muenchen]EDR8536543.1 DUF2919 family protein [Salmonella enterica subsp. enterica]EDX5815445.1 DUF2919 family protein [Salmonella enterica subsp. enterica serovar Muenchen]EEP7000066.1 DUF2919 family protein [Salmonella enterica]
MKHLPFCHPGDFDDNGLLKAPVLFWVGLVVMARAWWLMGADGHDGTRRRYTGRFSLAGYRVTACRAGGRRPGHGDAVYLSAARTLSRSGSCELCRDTGGSFSDGDG